MKNNNFGYVLLVALLASLIAGLLSFLGSGIRAKGTIDIAITRLEEKQVSHYALLNQSIESVEKTQAERYQTLVKITDEIKTDLKMKQDISGIELLNFNKFHPMITRSPRIDSTEFYRRLSDSLHIELMANFKCIKNSIENMKILALN